MKVYVVSAGMGNPDTLTAEALRAIEASELLVGAKRLLDAFEQSDARKAECIVPDDIEAALARAERDGCAQACVLMSGDVGFYSGAAKLYERLGEYDVEAIPGVSSLQYFCAKLRMPWQDAALVSAHGRDCDVAGAVQAHAKTFFLTGGKTKVEDICRELAQNEMGDLPAAAGERLSYADERIVRATAAELAQMEFAHLAVLLVENPHA